MGDEGPTGELRSVVGEEGLSSLDLERRFLESSSDDVAE